MPDKWKTQFVQSVKAFIEWADGEPSDPDSEAWKALELVLDLYRCAMHISLPVCEEMIEAPSIDYQEWKAKFDRFAALPFQCYSVIFNPMITPPEEPVIGDICDDLADIYRDLAEGIALYQMGRRNEAFWIWRFGYRHHWGQHAAWAIQALDGYFSENPDRRE